MDIALDTAKDEANKQKHGVSLTAVSKMDLDLARVIGDRRFDYGETRYLAYAPIQGRLHILYHTITDKTLRLICGLLTVRPCETEFPP